MSNRFIALILLALAAGCGGSDDLTAPGSHGSTPPPDPVPAEPQPPPPAEPPAPDPLIAGRAVFAVDLVNRLLLFGTESPETLARQVTIGGLGAGHRIVSIDFRG